MSKSKRDDTDSTARRKASAKAQRPAKNLLEFFRAAPNLNELELERVRDAARDTAFED